MGQVKRLELWWQLYVTWLPRRDVRNIRPMDFCSTECTTQVTDILYSWRGRLASWFMCTVPICPDRVLYLSIIRERKLHSACTRVVPRVWVSWNYEQVPGSFTPLDIWRLDASIVTPEGNHAAYPRRVLVCQAVFTLDAGLLARSQYSEGPATGHLDTGFSWCPCVWKQMLRWFPRFQSCHHMLLM